MTKYRVLPNGRVEKTNFSVDFLMSEVKEHYNNLKKALIESEAKVKLEQATQANILENHPDIETVSEITKQGCFLLVKSKLEELPAVERVNQIKKAIEEYDKELAEIEKQTSVKLNNEDKLKQDE